MKFKKAYEKRKAKESVSKEFKDVNMAEALLITEDLSKDKPSSCHMPFSTTQDVDNSVANKDIFESRTFHKSPLSVSPHTSDRHSKMREEFFGSNDGRRSSLYSQCLPPPPPPPPPSRRNKFTLVITGEEGNWQPFSQW